MMVVVVVAAVASYLLGVGVTMAAFQSDDMERDAIIGAVWPVVMPVAMGMALYDRVSWWRVSRRAARRLAEESPPREGPYR